jgi:hypothetical protein
MMTDGPVVRDALPAEWPLVEGLHTTAFPQEVPIRLLRALARPGPDVLSLVAEKASQRGPLAAGGGVA